MKSGLLALLALVALAVPAVAIGGPTLGDERISAAERPFVPGEVVVRFEPGVTAAERLAARQGADVDLDRTLRVPRTQVVEVDGSVTAAVERLEDQPGVAFAQPNYRYHALAVAPPNDTFFGSLWGLEDPAPPNPGVDVLEGWEVTRGAGQVIAIVDTGVALDHPDLQGNLWTGPGGVHGHDFVDGDDDPDDYNFHGTHVAGTAAAIDDDGLGVAGVAPDAQIMAVRVLDGDGSGSSADIGDGIAYAAQNGADVINLSLGGPSGAGDQFMSSAVSLADQRNAVVVAAAGNDDNDNDANPTTPCTLPQANLICVAAVTQTGALAGFSNFGDTTVDVGAPGTNVLSAKTDYGPGPGAGFSEGFDTDLAAWDTFGNPAWDRTSAFFSAGTHSVTDSPAGDYPADADSELFTASPLNMTAERGCRIHLDVSYDIEPPGPGGVLFDAFFVGAVADTDLDVFDGLPFAGQSSDFDSGSFVSEEVSISDLDGRTDVLPFLAVFADDIVQADGAYADDLQVLCRDDTYLDSLAASGNYVAFQGTSMAAPHVAGVAALVGAADPGAPDTQVVSAIKSSGTPLASLSGTTATGRTVDSDAAIAAALAIPNPPPAKPASPAKPSPPPRPNLAGAKRKLRASKSGRFSYRFKATPGMNGSAVFKTVKKVKVSRRARVTLARRSFSVIRADGVVTVAVRLSKRNLRILERNRKLVLNVIVTVRNFAGLKSQASKRLTLLAPKRR